MARVCPGGNVQKRVSRSGSYHDRITLQSAANSLVLQAFFDALKNRFGGGRVALFMELRRLGGGSSSFFVYFTIKSENFQ